MKHFHIHFVCTGNVYRSRLAETYLRSKQVSNVEVSSSGIKAAENQYGPIVWYASRLITRGKLVPHMKPSWTQTSPEILNTADIVIFMADEHHAYAKTNFNFNKTSYEIWNIGDLKDAGFTDDKIGTEFDMQRILHTEKIFAEIKKKVDELVTRLKKN